MSPLQLLRQTKHIARWVLLWFALSLTAAVAAPLVHPQAMTLVCTSAGQLKLVADTSAQTGKGALGAVGDHHSMNCVLCLALDAPPAQASDLPLALLSARDVLVRATLAWVPQRYTSQMSARGPPALA